MSTHYVVVDGSNIATEGRSLPSLRQLDEAVRAFLTEHPADQLTVVVDATFGHRIDNAEHDAYEEAVLAGELVSPPAGAIGRGDAFVLQIADKVDAVILSNDSFQEFHGQYPWLFDEGRLIGGKPVPGLGWVFVPRTPVRGPASRRSVKDAKEPRSAGGTKRASGGRTSTRGQGGRTTPSKKAGGRASSGGSAPAQSQSRRRRGPAKPGEQLNELLPFVDFVAAHPVGSKVEAEVESFSSHGAYAIVGDVRCYIPFKAMGDPPPAARARRVVGRRDANVRRRVDRCTASRHRSVAHPGRATDASRVASTATRRSDRHDPRVSSIPARARKPPLARAVTATHLPADHHAEEAPVTPVKKAAAKKAAKKAPARKRRAKKAPARKTAAKKAPARKRVAKKAPARKTAARKAPARKRVAKKAPARKTAAQKAPARKRVAKKAPARKTAARKAPARKRVAKKAPARKTAATQGTRTQDRSPQGSGPQACDQEGSGSQDRRPQGSGSQALNT